MAVSEQLTYTLLNSWQRRMKANAWHFAGISGVGVNAPLSDPGDIVYVQPEREILAEGIVNALGIAVPFLGFYHRPVYIRQEIQFTSGWPGAHGKIVRLKRRHIQAVGKRGTTLIAGGNASVVYSDRDLDGVDEWATVTVTLPAGVTDPAEVQAFFKQSDSLNTNTADERWQIEPLQVSISGTTATLQGHKSLFVNPALWRFPYRAPNYNSSSKNTGTTTDAADFVTNVDVYRIYPDATGAVVFYSTPTEHCTDCEYSTSEGTAIVASGELGTIRLCSDCSVTPCLGYTRKVVIWTLAGYPLDPVTGLPEAALETAMIRLANSEMPYEPTDLSDVVARTWLHDWTLTPPSELPPDLVNNPFGVKRGQVAAYRTMLQYKSVTAGAQLGSRF